MTTASQALANDAIPPWFMDFANENARQHAELAGEIAKNRIEIAENRTEMHREFASLLRWVVGMTAGMGVAVVGSLIYAVERLA